MGDILLRQFTTTGGPILVCLVLLSVIATATTIFKIVQFLRLGVGRREEAETLLARAGDGPGLLSVNARSSPSERVVRAVTSTLSKRSSDLLAAERSGLETALGEMEQLSRYMRVLEIVVQAAPMLGLLGTVIGMIETFGQLSQSSGTVDPSALAGGIWIALTTTALGLVIAVPFYILSVWLDGRIENERGAMELFISKTLSRAKLAQPIP